MKKIVAYIISNILYYIGDLVCRLSYVFKNSERLPNFYQVCMANSIKVQDWGGNKTPWTNVEDK